MSIVRLVSVALVATACSSGITTLRVTPAPRQTFAVMSDSVTSFRARIATDSASAVASSSTSSSHLAHASKP